MEDEIKNITKTTILTELNKYFQRCKLYVFFIDNDILRICAKHNGEEFQQVYVNPIERLCRENDYVKRVIMDFVSKFNRWILIQYRGW